MDAKVGHDLVKGSTCTTCQFTEGLYMLHQEDQITHTFLDFSNYWTAVLYFKAKNGTYKRVPQRAQQGMEGTNGGMVCLCVC